MRLMQFLFSKLNYNLNGKILNILTRPKVQNITTKTMLLNSIFLVACLSLSACSFPPRIYRFDIQQGSDISQEMVNKLKRGMTKEKVQETLGTPTLTHTLDASRWDYYYSLTPGKGGPKIEKHFSVFFKGDRLVDWTPLIENAAAAKSAGKK